MNQSVIDKETFFAEMKKYAIENHVPVMNDNALATMIQFMRLQSTTSVLEIGTAIGYSALRMADALPTMKICTVERNQRRYETALTNLNKADERRQISIIYGDVQFEEENISKHAPFDCIFIDAAKAQYQKFFTQYEKYLTPKGIIFSDNSLFKGLNGQIEEIKDRRKRALVRKINQYNDWLLNNPDYETVIVETGDGLAVSIKK